MKIPHLVFVGIKGAVIALDRNSGTIVWKADVPGSTFVNLADDGERLYALSQGEVLSFDAATGVRLWHNPLKGFGMGLGALLVPGGRGQNSSAAVAHLFAEQESASAAGGAATAPAL